MKGRPKSQSPMDVFDMLEELESSLSELHFPAERRVQAEAAADARAGRTESERRGRASAAQRARRFDSSTQRWPEQQPSAEVVQLRPDANAKRSPDRGERAGQPPAPRSTSSPAPGSSPSPTARTSTRAYMNQMLEIIDREPGEPS